MFRNKTVQAIPTTLQLKNKNKPALGKVYYENT